MKKITLLVLLPILFFSSCKKDDSPRQKRFLDKIVIEKAKLAAWDILDGPDMYLTYRDGLDSTSLSGQSEVIDDVAATPITFEDVPFELTDYMDFKVMDVDQWVSDQVMYELQFNPYQMTEEGNPFTIWNPDWNIKIYWKTQ